jgi:hypothetical protein
VREPAVEKHVRHGKNGRTVDVVLNLLAGLIADPYGPHAPVTGQGGKFALVEARPAVDAVNRLDAAVGRAGCNIDEIIQIPLHRVGRAQAVERVHDEVGIPKPAVAVVPVASGPGRLGNGRGHRRDDGARVLEGVELQGNGGADDLLLPLEGNGQVPHPVTPAVHGFIEEAAGNLADGVRNGFIRPQNQRGGAFEKERQLLKHGGHGDIGSQPQNPGGSDIPDVVAAVRHRAVLAAVFAQRPDAHADAGTADEAPDLPDDHHGHERATVLMKAGS